MTRQPPLVLVAEDQPGVRRLLEEVLRRAGYRIALAGDGREALAAAAAEAPALALLDLRMPVMDGLQTLRALKERAPGLPVLLMTGAGEEEGMAEALAAGAAGCIQKPFDLRALRRWAAELLGEGESGMAEALLRVRMSAHDAHYGGNLVDGARVLALFGDAATELLIRHDGDEGLFVAYDMVEFKAPVYAGDYLEVRARITRVGNTSRSMSFEAFKVIQAEPVPEQPSRARVLPEPVLVVRATGTCMVPREYQRPAE